MDTSTNDNDAHDGGDVDTNARDASVNKNCDNMDSTSATNVMDASANDNDAHDGNDISVRGKGEDSDANTDASTNDKDDNEGGGWHISQGKGR